MSNLEEQEEATGISILSIESLEERRAVLTATMSAIEYHENSISEFHSSEERIELLAQSKGTFTRQVESLERKQRTLLELIQNEPIKLQQLNQYSNDIDDIVNANLLRTPNVKISKITGWASSDGVMSLTLELSDSGTRQYGPVLPDNWTGGTKVGPFILEPTEFVVKIDKIASQTASSLGNAIIFYTSSNRKHIIKGNDVEIDQSKFSEEKIFMVNRKYARWEWHEAEAKRQGYTLASIADSGENNKISTLLRQERLGSAWAGGKRIRRGRGKGSDTWKWVDGTPWTLKSAWNGGEPNDCCGGENYLQLHQNGRWNDLFPYDLPAVYSRLAERYTTNSVTSGGSDMGITGITNIDDMTVETDTQYIDDTAAMDNLKNLKKDVRDLTALLDGNTDDYSTEFHANVDLLKKLKALIEEIDQEIVALRQLNASVTDGFTNMDQIGGKITSVLNNIFGNSNNKPMREGMDGGQPKLNSPFYDYIQGLFSQTRQSINSELATTDRIEYEEERNYMLELISQKDNVLSNVLMDYMVNDTKGSNAEKVYEQLDQENRDKLRQIKMNDYNTKTMVEYSSILKFIVLLIVIMIPFLLLAKYEIMNRNVSLFFVVAIGFVGFVNIIYRMYRISRKDNKDFDKDIIPYDRKTAELMKDGKLMKKSGGGLGGFGITCIGEQCCTDGMLYDSTQNRCYATSENFGNFFENSIEAKNQVESEILDNDLHELSKEFSYIKEPFLSSSADLASFKTRALVDSLNNSSADKMMK